MLIKKRGFKTIFILSCLLFLNVKVIPQSSVPNNFGKKKFVLTFLNAVNSNNRKQMGTFINQYYSSKLLKLAPLPRLVSVNMEFYYQTVGLGYELVKIDSSASNIVSVDLYNKFTETYINLQIPVTGATPPKIDWFIKTSVNTTKKYKPPHKISEAELRVKVNFALNKLERDDEFSGAILIAKDGKTIFNKAVGDASKSYHFKNKTDTKFNIASVGKIFTGLAVIQLAEQGKLSYDDTVDKYIGAEWLKPDVASKIQIKHLLTHTSGLGDYFKDAYAQNTIPFFRNLNDYKLLLADDELEFKPGTKFSYSNSGMLILGVIIEKVSGGSYFNCLDKFIFQPAGMNNTGAFYKDRPVENRATGYTKIYENNEVTFDNHQFTRIIRGSPSGGVYSTVEDLLKFDVALRTDKLISAENKELIFEGRPELNAGFHSYALFIENTGAGKMATHKGDGNGVSAQFSMYLDNGYTFAVLSNYSRPAANIVADIISALINKVEN